MADRVRENLIFAHQEWIGFVQPVGLVVAPTVMVDAQVVPDRNISGRQRDFCELLEEKKAAAQRLVGARPICGSYSSTISIGRKEISKMLRHIRKSWRFLCRNWRLYSRRPGQCPRKTQMMNG